MKVPTRRREPAVRPSFIWLAAMVMTLAFLPHMLNAAEPAGEAGYQPVGADRTSPGAVVYRNKCAACHDQGLARAPQEIVLRNMRPDRIYEALVNGTMKAQGSALTEEQKVAVSEYLGQRKLDSRATTKPANICEGKSAEFDRTRPPMFTGWGLDPQNTHGVSRNAAGIVPQDVASLKLKWAFGFANSDRIRSQPALAGGAIFIGSQDGFVYALDRKTGCVRWRFDAPAEVRTTIVIEPWDAGDKDASPHAWFADQAGNVFAVEAFTGKLAWQLSADDHAAAVITASPALHDGTVFVPVSSLEEASAAAPGYVCCTFRGSILALDAWTGREKWRSYLVDEPKPRPRDDGKRDFGPSGVAVWNTPAVDADRNQIVFATGDNYSNPPTDMSDAIIALDMATGAINWHYQATEGDAWNVSCVVNSGNCPEDDGPDFDFGAGTMVIEDSGGRPLALAGQKSGIAYALDATNGELVWQSRVGRGGLAGGILFGMASTGDRLFVPVTDAGPLPGAQWPASPGLYALNIDTGERLWSAPALPGACEGKTLCDPGLSGAISATPDLVFAGADDGLLRIHGAASGKVLWEMDLVRPFETVNGVEARGGTIGGGTAPIAEGGQLIVASGYGFASKMPGNVLLVFEVSDDGGKDVTGTPE